MTITLTDAVEMARQSSQSSLDRLRQRAERSLASLQQSVAAGRVDAGIAASYREEKAWVDAYERAMWEILGMLDAVAKQEGSE